MQVFVLISSLLNHASPLALSLAVCRIICHFIERATLVYTCTETFPLDLLQCNVIHNSSHTLILVSVVTCRWVLYSIQ